MFPHRSLILDIVKVAIFSIEVPERERELSEEQYAIKVAAEVAYCFELNSLSLWHWSAEKGNRRIAIIKTTGGGLHFTFFIYTW